MLHVLVASEVGALHFTLRSDEMREFVGVKFMLLLVPEEFLTAESHAFHCENAHIANEMPEFIYREIVGSVRLDVGFHMEFLVELFEEQSATEYPSGRVEVFIDFPSLGNDAVLHYTRVADKGVYAVACHHGHGVTVVNSGRSVFLRIVASEERERHNHADAPKRETPRSEFPVIPG